MVEPQRPNLVFVFPDQMRGSAMGFLNQEPVRTPHLDRFAEQSVVLTEAASAYPVCSPYRAMLMSGQYPHRNGVLSNCNNHSAAYGTELSVDQRCWSDVLNDEGYSLGYIGKWHLDSPHEPYVDCANNRGDTRWNEWCPPRRRHGFDFWYAYGTYNSHMNPMYWRGDAPRDGFHFVDQWGPRHEADMAIRYIRNDGAAYRNDDQPFALVVSMNPPHTPYDAHPDRYLDDYADVSDEQLFDRPNIPPPGTHWGDHYRKHIRDYYASITGVDEQFGRIVAAIDEAGLGDDTIIVFTSDHGDCLGIHEHHTKSIWWEESMHVPFMIRWPGRLTPRHDDLLINAPDIYPTLLGLLGLADHAPQNLQGTDHSGVIQTAEGERPTSQLYQWLAAARPEIGARGVRTHRHTLVVADDAKKFGKYYTFPDYAQTSSPVMLFDRVDDPYQLKDIAAEHPQLVTQLIEQELKPWLAHADDPYDVSRHVN